MMFITAIIVEDQPMSADILKKFCERSGRIRLLHHFPDAIAAEHFLQSNKVDLVFLDVEMPGPSGFDLLDQLSYKPQVIMTTADSGYAFTAFEYHVTDYLKKPYTYQRFTEAIDKIPASAPLAQQEVPAEKPSAEEEIFIRCNGQLVKLKSSDILYIESMGDYVRFVTREKKYITHNSMKKLLSQINPDIFCQVHRSYIINLDKLNDFRDNNASIDGHLVPVSKSNKAKVLNQIRILQ